MLDMLIVGYMQINIKGVPYMMMEGCISIRDPEKITPKHAAYATKVITKPKYIIMAGKIVVGGNELYSIYEFIFSRRPLADN